ncbi:MAG: class I SAM-dependent RNA methyltransferase [Cyanobium sp.]
MAALHWDGIAVVPPGLEEPAATELTALGCCAVQRLSRAVRFRTDQAGFYRLQLQARLPFRLLRLLASFPCRNKEELHRGVQAAADWSRWLPPSVCFKVEASGSAPGLSHSHYTALAVKNALVDWQRSRFGERSSIDLDDPDLGLHVHLGGGQASLSLDGSGASLHRRGYRPALGLAPLKENLAAGLIALTGWDGTVPLADPLCGSGTLLIEAVRLALGRAPGLGAAGGAPLRRFALERWPDLDAELWQRQLAAARELARDTLADGRPLAPVLGLERDPAVIDQACSNADAAGVAPWITLQQGDCRDFQPPPQPGVLVCNPPYGVRLGEHETLEGLYADLGAMVKERCSGWTLWLLSGNPQLTGALRMKASRRIPVSNGGIDCRWLRYEIR